LSKAQYQDRKFQQSSQPPPQEHPQQSQQQSYPQQSHDNQSQPNNPQQSQEYGHLRNRQKFQHGNDKFHVQERPYGQFSRSIELPNNIMSDDEFHASLENGVLRIRLPKNNERPRKKITIT
jgi:hypothetical protein